MPTTKNVRHGVLRLARYAAAAGGLGLGWLLLAGGAASANDASTTTAPAPSAVASSHAVPGPAAGPRQAGGLLQPVVSIVRAGTGTVSTTVESVPTTVSRVQQTTSTVVSTTTKTVAGVVQQTVPTVVEPVLTGPLAPLAPVVNGATSTLGGTVASVGGTVGGTVSALPLPQLTAPAAQLGQTLVTPAPVQSAPSPAPVATPQGAGAAQPAASTAAPSAPSANSASAGQTPKAMDWAQFASSPVSLAQFHGASFRGASDAAPASGSDHGTTPGPQPGQNLLGSASSSLVLRGGSHNPLAVASAETSANHDDTAAGTLGRRSSSLLDPPAFDPGSTPD